MCRKKIPAKGKANEEARNNLKGSILKRRASLSEAEEFFLHALLVEEPQISKGDDDPHHTKKLEKASQVLNDDVLFSVPPTDENQEDASKVNANKTTKRPSILGLWQAHEDGVAPKSLALRGSLSLQPSAGDLKQEVEESDQEEEKKDTNEEAEEEDDDGSADEADKKLSSHDTTAVRIPADVTADNADTDPVKGRSKRTPEEDAKLISAVKSTCKKKTGMTDWAAVAVLVPNRTKTQCRKRWHNGLDPNIDRANGSTARWTEDDDKKLRDALQTHGDKNWASIAALVPGRTRSQCYNRWQRVLNPNIDRANECRRTWTEDEDIKLKEARIGVQLPHWFRVERINSVWVDGIIT
jgi:hypothetical protein